MPTDQIRRQSRGIVIGAIGAVAAVLVIIIGAVQFFSDWRHDLSEQIGKVVPAVENLLKTQALEQQVEASTSLDDAHRALGRIEGKCEAEILHRLFNERYGDREQGAE